jgi:hypothetical protein
MFVRLKRCYTDNPWVYVRAEAIDYLEEIDVGLTTRLNFSGGCSIAVDHEIEDVRERVTDAAIRYKEK